MVERAPFAAPSDGVRVRPACPGDAAGIALVHVESWRTTYRGLLPASFLDGLSVDRRRDEWRRHLETAPSARGLGIVADHREQGIVGFASAGPRTGSDDRLESELYTLYLLEAWQGRSLGRHLLHQVVADLRTLGFRSMRAWVFEGNRAVGFYEHLGGSPVERRGIRVGDGVYPAVCLAWPDLTAFPRTDGPT